VRRAEIERLLPTMYQLAARPGSPLQALLGVMEVLHAPAEEILGRLDDTFDPYRTPDEFVPWLSRWLGLEWLVQGDDDGAGGGHHAEFAPGVGRLRDVVAVGHALAQWRGTQVALVMLLAAATGIEGYSVDEPDGRPFHLVVHAPAEARVHESVVRRAVEVMKPAATRAEIVFAGAASDTGREEESR
jgi:phage tail-like protein